jgi:hypothetical protein
MAAGRNRAVFINCPFDAKYQPLFEAIVFCVTACGFRARCTLEENDTGEVRIDTIYKLIRECNHGIHDISRTEVKGEAYELPRFNMPFELGIFLGAKKFGPPTAKKRCLVMDRAPYLYKRFISDIAGQDIKAHRNSPCAVTRQVRNWLQAAPGKADLPGGQRIWQKYRQFRRELPVIAHDANLNSKQLTFIDYLQMVTTWLKRNRY